jgi:DNA-binding XRE family transcriptional regulator
MKTSIKQYRLKNGITQQELVDILGIKQGTYSKKENGLVRFSLEEAKTIADHYNTSVDAIFFEENYS